MGAWISDCGRYRYTLERSWSHADSPRMVFLMLNPSTADAETDDATIRSCRRLAKANGAEGFNVINLFAFRATNPADLERCADAIGPQNDQAITEVLATGGQLICAWGAQKIARRRAVAVARLIIDRWPEIDAWCLGNTRTGAPKHPLYIRSDQALMSFDLRSVAGRAA